MQQGGIIREAKNEKNESIFSDDEKKIFDAADKNGGKANGVLDKEELNKFLEDLKAAAGNGRLSKREANKFLKEHGLKDVDPKTLFSFVDKISQSSENIKSCQMDAEGNIIIEYNDDKTETINSENQTSTIQSNDGKITEEYNAARELTKKTVKENETDSTTTEYSGVDKDGNPIRTKETVISEKEVEDPSKKEKTTTTTTFENGKKKVITTSKDSGFSIITTLDENEKPKTEVETQGKYTEIHREYVDGNKNPRETKRFENKGLDIQKEYTYEYSEDGTEVKESISELGGTKNTVTIKKDDVLISKDITEPDKTTKVTQNKEGGYTEEITEGTTVTQNELNSEMKRLSQTKQVGTKQYQLTYDGSGNTAGIIVQNGESPAAIAKKFGVPLDKLREANADKLNGKKYFAVGEEIKIPREMEADEKVLRGRKDAQGAKAEYAQEQARIQAEREARRQQIAAENKIYKQLGLKNRKGAGTTIHDNKGNAYTVIGQAAFGRTIARKGKSIHVIAHDGVDLKTDYVVKDIENVKAGKKRIVVNGRAYYTDGAARDRHGRMNVTDWTGKKAILSGGKSKTDLSDRVILKNNYVEATDALDAGRGKKTYLDNGIQYVKSSDGKYWYFNEKGQAINAEQVEKQVAEKVAADLDDAADGWFFGAGTDEALMSKANAGISSPGILSKIEAHYQNKGFKANSEYKTAYEAFQGSELQRSEVYVNNAQLVKNNAIQDQSRRDEIISTNITEYGKTNENLQAGLDAIGNRTDFENANKAAQKYNQEKEYNPQFKNQSPINTLIYGQSDGDAESIRAANNKLIDPQENFLTSKEITRTLAEEGVYFLQEAKDHTIMKGLKDQDKEAALESNNADVYAMMDTLLKEKGEPSLKDTVDNARLATVGYGNFDADERAKLALDELMSSLNYTKSAESTPVGSMTMGTAFSSTASIMSDSKNAGLSINTLYKVLNSPESYKKFKELVNTNPDLKKYLTKIGFDESKLLFEAKSSNLSQDKIDNNKALVEVMRKAILQNRNEFQNITGQEGAIDSFLNRFRTTYGLGVTRETLSLLGQNSSYMLHNLELAAEGKLTDSKGTPISFEDYAKKLNISTQTMEEANVTYQTHQAYARMGLDVATTIATIPVGAGVVKILSTVANGVKTFKVVQTLDAAGKTVKEIGVVKKLADAQKLATTTAKAFLADSKAGQATIQVAQNLTSSSNIARSATMGLTNGTVMYGKERLNQVTSTQGDNMVARSEAENNFASNSAAAGVGFHVGAGVAPLDDLGAVGRALGAATEITSDAATSAAINYAQTGEAFVSKEDMATSIIFNVAGHTSIGKGHSKAPQVEPQGVLEHATGNGSHQSGGKLNPEKMDLARQQVADVAQHGTPQEVAHVQNEADLQQAQIRSQGKELKHVIEDNAGFVAIGKERIALDSSDFDALARAKKEVSNWTDGTRDKEAILAKINKRMDEINAGQVKPTEPARGVDVVEHINDKVNQNAEHILDGNTGAIGSHDAATLRDQLANNLKSEGEIEQFIADIKQRVGVDEKGNMHVYQVQGKDHAADLVNAAEKKLKDIRANKANFEEASSILDKANAAGKGLSEDELKTLKSVAGKMTDSESLQSLIDKMKSNKKIKGHSGAKKAIGEMEAQVQTLKKAEAGHVQKAQTAEEPQGASDGAVADFAAEQRRMIAEGKLNPEGTPIETQPKVKPDETPIEAQPKAESKETPATHKVEEPQGASDGAVADFAAEQRRMIAEGKLNADGTPIKTQPKAKADETPIEAQPKAESKETPAVRNASEQKVSEASANSAEVKPQTENTNFSIDEIKNFKNELYENHEVLNSKMKEQGFELSEDSPLVYNGKELYHYYNKKSGISKVFESNPKEGLVPRRMFKGESGGSAKGIIEIRTDGKVVLRDGNKSVSAVNAEVNPVEINLTPQKVAGMKKEAVALDIEIKASNEITAQQKQLWSSVKEKYEVILDSVKSMKDGIKSSGIATYCKDVLQGLKSIAKTAPKAIKEKLAKMAKNIQNIMHVSSEKVSSKHVTNKKNSEGIVVKEESSNSSKVDSNEHHSEVVANANDDIVILGVTTPEEAMALDIKNALGINDQFANTIAETINKKGELKDKLVQIIQNSAPDAGKATALIDMATKANVDDLVALSKNGSLNVTYDTGFVDNDFDTALTMLQQNPQYHKEIVTYLSVQRAVPKLSMETRFLNDYISLLQEYPKQKDLIVKLASNPNLENNGTEIRTLTEIIQKNPRIQNDVLALSAKKYDFEMIQHKIDLMNQYPELRSSILDNPPTYQLIDKAPGRTSATTMQQRKELENKALQLAPKELNALKTTLGDNFFQNVKWEDIIPASASQKEIKAILTNLNDESKFFARSFYNEDKYSKNIAWAHEINNVSIIGETLIRNGEDFRTVVGNISEGYRRIDIANTLKGDPKGRRNSGLNRENWTPEAQPSTPIDNYPEYENRLNKLLDVNRTAPYSDIELTEIRNINRGVCMIHPANKYVTPGLKHMEDAYNTLQPLFNKVQKGGSLNPNELEFAHKQISEIYYLMANVMPWARGSNGISDVTMRSMYKALNIEMPAMKHGVSLDLEAFDQSLSSYQANWKSFFEDGIEVKPGNPQVITPKKSKVPSNNDVEVISVEPAKSKTVSSNNQNINDYGNNNQIFEPEYNPANDPAMYDPALYDPALYDPAVDDQNLNLFDDNF